MVFIFTLFPPKLMIKKYLIYLSKEKKLECKHENYLASCKLFINAAGLSATKIFNRICPTLQLEELSPGYVGIQPSLYKDKKRIFDFIFEQKQVGDTLQIHLLGMDSLGFTSSLAIGEKILEIVK